MPAVKKTTKKNVSEKAEAPAEKSLKILPTKEENVFSKIARTVTQLSVAIVALVAVFSPDNAWVLGPIIGSLAIMGIALGYFASK